MSPSMRPPQWRDLDHFMFIVCAEAWDYSVLLRKVRGPTRTEYYALGDHAQGEET
jgi:hypothetical protein